MTTTDIAPTRDRERVLALDVVRGMAVLGILVMNIVEFGLPMRAYDNPAYAGGHEGPDLWTWIGQATLFDGRMRALFSMLFGAGMVMLSQRLEASGRGGTTADLLLRRCLWLLLFGIAHRFLLQWTGDILYIYGLLGTLAIAFRVMRPRTLVILGTCLGLVFVPLNVVAYGKVAQTRDNAAAAQQLVDTGGDVPADLQEDLESWNRRKIAIPPTQKKIDEEVEAILDGWVSQARLRWDHNHEFQHAYVYYYFFFDVMGMVLIGMALMKLGFFTGAMSTASYLGFVALGAAATAWSAWLAAWRIEGEFALTLLDQRFWHQSTYFFARLFGALGEGAILLLVVRAGALRMVTDALAFVGRMAFTNYVLQTVLCSLFFWGYGLGYYGALSRSQLMLVVLAVSAVQIAFSMSWLRPFRFGPLEWCWRSLTYWQRQPMRRVNASLAEPPDPARSSPA